MFALDAQVIWMFAFLIFPKVDLRLTLMSLLQEKKLKLTLSRKLLLLECFLTMAGLSCFSLG